MEPEKQPEKPNDKPVSPAPEISRAPERPFEKPTESRANRFLVRALRWLAAILIFMGLGALLVVFTLYKPMQQTLGESQNQGVQANQRISELESQVETLSTLEAKNKQLQAELDKSELHIAILSARADVATAQVALAQDDQNKARQALKDTPQTLKKIEGLLKPSDKQQATYMQDRLNLAVKGIGVNAYAAASDLDVLSTSLVDLEKTYFATP
jgi:cytoskeletal protein RodZ